MTKAPLQARGASKSSTLRKTSIEDIRRRDLVEAAFQTFLDYGMSGTTVARIGERAGMSHGIVNYYFKSKDQLLSAVIRHAFLLIQRYYLLFLSQAKTPRQRVSAVISGNFPEELFNQETAAAWVSFFAEVPTNADFERMQDLFYRRLHSNLVYHLRQLTNPANAGRIALGISVWIDGLWLRSAMKQHGFDRHAAIRAIEEYVDGNLRKARPGSRRGSKKNARPTRREP
jgi:transcriptional repressor BetI